MLITTSAFFVAFCAPTMWAQTPTFRTSVEVVSIDAVVLTPDGKPDATLTANEFTVLVNGQPRTVSTAQFVAGRPRSTAAKKDALPVAPASASNAPRPGGHTFMFVLDAEGITAGNGRGTLDRIADFAEQRGPDDLVGVVTLPAGAPAVDLTTAHGQIRRALERASGFANFTRSSEMSPGEAVSIARGDGRSLDDYLERIGAASSSPAQACRMGASGFPPSSGAGASARSFGSNIQPCIDLANRAVARYRNRSKRVIEGLGAVAKMMQPLPAPKTIILVSEGLLIDEGVTADITQLAREAEAARVALYALQLRPTLTQAADRGGPTSAMRVQDLEVGLSGLTAATSATGGAALQVVATADAALSTIAQETDGHYVLAFDRAEADLSGSPAELQVRVKRPGYQVRFHRTFAPPISAREKSGAVLAPDPKATIGQLLRQPLPAADLRLDASVYPSGIPDATGQLSATVVVDIQTQAMGLRAIGFEIVGPTGAVIADSFEPQPTTLRRQSGTSVYLARVALNAGDHELRFAALDSSGFTGSVRCHFSLAAAPPSAELVSQMLLGEISGGAFVPRGKVGEQFAARLDLLRTASTPRAAKVYVAIAGEDARELGRQEVPIVEAPATHHLQATANLSLRALPPGAYTVIFEAVVDGRVALREARRVLRE